MIIYEGHSSPVISIAVSPTGEYFATGDNSGLMCVWETLSSRQLYAKTFNDPIYSIDWSPSNIIGFSHG